MLSSINSNFLNLNDDEKLITLLCPADAKSAKLINKVISILISARSRIDNGESIDIGYFTNDNLNDSGSEEWLPFPVGLSIQMCRRLHIVQGLFF